MYGGIKMVKDKKEVEEIKVLTCPVCNKETNPEDWNPYFGACEPCVNGSGRIGS